MRVVFRVDASVHMGTGHLMRCLTLAEVLQGRGVAVKFVCKEHAGNLNSLLQSKNMSVTVLSALADEENTLLPNGRWMEDAKQTIQVLNGVKPEWLVVDHYGLDIEWERRVRPYVGRIMVIDDFPGRNHDCDALLDQNYSVEGGQRYAGFVPPACKTLLGPNYALLRKEFQTLREHIGSKAKEIKNILVFFTAGDDQGETLKAMQGIEIFGKVEHVDVVVGQSNPDNAAIQMRCNELHWGYHCQVDYMPKLIAQADMAIGAGGSSNWERCALGVPALVAILAENQVLVAQALDRAGAVCNLGWCNKLRAEDYADALSKMSCQRLSSMSKEALGIVDAIGAERVVDALLFS